MNPDTGDQPLTETPVIFRTTNIVSMGIVWGFFATACSGPAPICAEDEIACDGPIQKTCINNTWIEDTCPVTCTPQVGCSDCNPGNGTCEGEESVVCREDGKGYDRIFCDPLLGLSCGQSGLCEGPCAPQLLGQTYIGCEYFPTVTSNSVSGIFYFAVIISNESADVANVHIDGGALTEPLQLTIQPNAVWSQRLPWQDALKSNLSVSVPGGAYHVRSDRPITLYQFNPLNYLEGAIYSGSNDASLVLPVNVLGTDYIVAAWPAWQQTPDSTPRPSFMAITASADNTNVDVYSRADVDDGANVAGFPAQTVKTFALNRGDTVELFSTTGDFTGSSVTADKPVQVIAGHQCTQIPADTGACDHLEESLFPTAALGTQYIVTSPAVAAMPAGKVRVVRIVATQPGTTVSYDPPQTGAPTSITYTGDHIELGPTDADFMITADKPVVVAEYMTGMMAGGNEGDPAFSIGVPVEQYRINYQFHAPKSYLTNYVNVVAKAGSTITLNGVNLASPTAIGQSGYEVYKTKIAKPDGSYAIEGTDVFGITVYGYGNYTSYWYPGGLDLEHFVVN